MRAKKPYLNTMSGGWDDECDFVPPTITDKDAEIRTFMHYSDPLAGGDPITVFGKAKKGLFYNYSDRLFGAEWERGWKKAQDAGLNPKTIRFLEVVLNEFHDTDTVDVQHVLLGVNRSSGYHYLVYGYTYKSRK